jgi:hypothetical protein
LQIKNIRKSNETPTGIQNELHTFSQKMPFSPGFFRVLTVISRLAVLGKSCVGIRQNLQGFWKKVLQVFLPWLA